MSVELDLEKMKLNCLLKVSHDWLVTELWQEKQQIHIT